MTGGAGDGLPIVVGVDPSDSAHDAALWAADLAAARGCELDLVHLASSRPGVVPDWLREIADAAERTGAAPATAEVVRGIPFDVLLTRSHRAAMVVVGSFGRDAPAGLLVGSTAVALVARAGCPVAVVRGRAGGLAPPRGGPVLVGVDGTPASDPALCLAVDLGAALGTGLLAVHCWSDAGDGIHRASDSWTELADRAARSLDDQLDRVASRVGACRSSGGPSRVPRCLPCSSRPARPAWWWWPSATAPPPAACPWGRPAGGSSSSRRAWCWWRGSTGQDRRSAARR